MAHNNNNKKNTPLMITNRKEKQFWPLKVDLEWSGRMSVGILRYIATRAAAFSDYQLLSRERFSTFQRMLIFQFSHETFPLWLSYVLSIVLHFSDLCTLVTRKVKRGSGWKWTVRNSTTEIDGSRNLSSSDPGSRTIAEDQHSKTFLCLFVFFFFLFYLLFHFSFEKLNNRGFTSW